MYKTYQMMQHRKQVVDVYITDLHHDFLVPFEWTNALSLEMVHILLLFLRLYEYVQFVESDFHPLSTHLIIDECSFFQAYSSPTSLIA